MSKHEKLKEKLLQVPVNFSYDEMVALLNSFGYHVANRGRTSGSAVMFYNQDSGDKIMFHKPHPGNELKKYILNMIIEKLKKNKML
ncbi:MAG: type II toxin-antitoxin system HicA family toxin [Bacteroidota bacterium]